MRAAPQAALDLVISFEQFKPCCYRPMAGDVATIGYGHTKGLSSADIGHVTITQTRARDYLAEDMAEAQAELEAACGADALNRLSELQYAALVSFAFNCGARDPSWHIWAMVRGGFVDSVPAQLMRFVNVAGRPVAGLVRRRTAEADLWRRGMAPAPVVVSPINEAPLPAAPDAPLDRARLPRVQIPAQPPAAPPATPPATLWALLLEILRALLAKLRR